ncbi:cache domain-containing protein [Candidatus Woesebacteria bacterium]|nr:cache domain-containing protein [Candidatus Woesebacteria bacterium]
MKNNPLAFRNTLRNVLLLFLIATLLVTIFSAVVVYVASFELSKREVDKIVTRMHEDIRYKNGFWDLYYLNSDPLLPGSYSHYILATQGYVIERWRPINGFIDTANLDHILQFQTIQTVTSPANETWRVYSQPLKQGESVVGGIFVSRYIGEGDDIAIIDKRLAQDMQFVKNKVRVNGETIDTSKLDVRETQYDISIKIVDKYNTIVSKTNNSNSIDRAPNYIDSSYVRRQLEAPRYRTIYDSVTNEPFLIVTSSVFDEQNKVVGVIIVGKSLTFLFELLGAYIVAMLLFTLILIPFVVYFYKKRYPGNAVKNISFDTTDGILRIDSSKIEIPGDTHQYHVLYCLFKNEDHMCTAEDISDQFGDADGNIWRRVYDVMLILNKKTEPYLEDKFIIIRNKKFLINPILHTKISKL